LAPPILLRADRVLFDVTSTTRSPPAEPTEPAESASTEEKANWSAALRKYRRKAAIAHNSFQIFAIGTAMSIAAGGMAGVVYHYVLHRLEHPTP
jgi:hypothetical protein